MEQKSKRGLQIGLAVSASATMLFLMSNRSTRNRIVGGTKKTAGTINEVSQFLSENREEIISQLRESSNRLSELLKSASADVEQISARAAHLKETTVHVKETTQQTARDIKNLKESEEGEESKQLESNSNVEKLPTGENMSS
ncbi:hypothetical protein [Alteribacillus sp. HJP-4]|uniref:hypothetical protein n=1 Tax=Alteribacillus sp. HJP-4 TaxID=2775394 RepID=UPI0035CD13C7